MGALLVKSDPTETCPRPRSRSITEPAREAGPRCPAPAQAGPKTSSNSLGVQGVYRPRQGKEEPKPCWGGGGGPPGVWVQWQPLDARQGVQVT